MNRELTVEEKGPVFLEPDENILKNTNLIQAQPKPDEFSSIPVLQSPEEVQQSLQNLWQNIKIIKVPINKHISLSYISNDDLKLVIQRLHNIQIWKQKRFKNIIGQMQKNDEEQVDYSSKIIENHEGYNYNILFLEFSRYLKSIFHPPTRRILQVADLLYPQGFLMQWAFTLLSKRKHGQIFELVNKFDFSVNLLSHLDEYHCSVFLVGGIAPLLAKVEKTFKTSFGNIKILGKYTANYRKDKTKLLNEIKTIINKSSPTLLLVAQKAHIQDFIENKNGERSLKSFLIIDYPEALQDFSGSYRRSKFAFGKIFLSLKYLIFPWLWFKLICMFVFILSILSLKILNKDEED